MANTKNSTNYLLLFVPIMLSFFAMGFVDSVGIATNYVKSTLSLSEFEANLFPSIVFLWFLIFSVPAGMLMNKIGRKNTVLISLIITFFSLLLPLFGETYFIMLMAFSLLGIGNTFMQTSLNPLISNMVNVDKLASTLTFGQFIKAIASCSAPLLAAWGATAVIPSFGYGWRVLFFIYLAISLITTIFLYLTKIEEERPDKAASFIQCFALLAKPIVLLSFLGIICHVGIDVGTNTTAPRIIQERFSLTLDEAGFATTLYFIFRTVGCFSGAFILRAISAKIFFGISVIIMLLAMLGLMCSPSLYITYACIGLIGFGNSNIFSIIFSQALINAPDKKNEVSGLLIMGLFGGTIFPLAMGYASDFIGGQNGAIAVMLIAVFYLIFYTMRIKRA